MKVKMMPGQELEFLTPDEFVKLIPRPREVTRMRVASTVALNSGGGGDDEVYKVPTGYEFAARRVSMTVSGVVDPNSSNVLLNAAGKWVAYLRSGQFIEYAQPAYGSTIQLPGVQTWGDQQGPYLRNGEVFGVSCLGLPANGILTVMLEGLLTRPSVHTPEKY